MERLGPHEVDFHFRLITAFVTISLYQSIIFSIGHYGELLGFLQVCSVHFGGHTGSLAAIITVRAGNHGLSSTRDIRKPLQKMYPLRLLSIFVQTLRSRPCDHCRSCAVHADCSTCTLVSFRTENDNCAIL
jgi:hypothetical protein